MSRHRLKILVVAGAAMVTGAAAAQTAPLTLTPYRAAAAVAPLPVKAVGAARPTPDLANPLDPLAPTALVANPVESVVFARTAIDHRFARRDEVMGSLGFLCGLQPGHNEAGAASAYGSDPHGRFIGAKLSFAFR